MDRRYAWTHIVSPAQAAMNLAAVRVPLLLSIEIDDFDEIPLPGGGRVMATPFLGEHSDLDIRAKSTHVMQIAGASIFVGADSSGIDPVLYRYIKGHLGKVDIYAMGEESWQGHVMATTYTPDTHQIKQIDEFLSWRKDHNVTAEHLVNKREWRW